jgi:hypothetical protein
VTGAHSNRRELLKLLNALVPGDVVTVTRIDRLARSTFDLFGIIMHIVDAKAPILGGTVGRYWHQHRALDAGGVGRRQESRQGPRKAYGPTPFPDTGTAERGHQTTCARRYVAGIGRQLRPQHIHHAPRDAGRMSCALPFCRLACSFGKILRHPLPSEWSSRTHHRNISDDTTGSLKIFSLGLRGPYNYTFDGKRAFITVIVQF